MGKSYHLAQQIGVGAFLVTNLARPAEQDLLLLETPGRTILASQRSGIRGMSDTCRRT
jgi:hypothetical protein